MSENATESRSSPSLIAGLLALSSAPPGTALAKWQTLVRVIAISIPVIGAIPTARNIYYSWKYDIPFGEVDYRLQQYKIWMNNVACQIDYRSISTARGLKVDVGGCPRTGDLALKLSGPDNSVVYQWIGFDQLQKPAPKTAGLFGLLVTEAQAAVPAIASSRSEPRGRTGSGLVHLAQAAGMQVMCEAVADKNRIVRVVKESGKCYRELVAPFAGRIQSRVEVPCDTKCDLPK